MNKQIDWFCFHCVTEELVSAEDCIAIADAIVEAGMEPDLTVFAQTVVDNELCSDVDRLETVMEMAVQEAATLGFPPQSIFDDEQDGAEDAEKFGITAIPDVDDVTEEVPPEELEFPDIPYDEGAGIEEKEEGPAYVAPPTEAPPVPDEDVEEWMRGWPVLAEAEVGDEEQARATMDAFLARAREVRCSDVHVSAGARPFVRRNKSVYLFVNQPVVSLEASEKLNLSLLEPGQREHFETTHDLDYCYAPGDNERYRTNVMLQRLGVSGSYRIIDNEFRSLKELGFLRTEIIEKLTTYHQGLILVTGPAGCGKSTTLSALVDLINRKRKDHIITVEDPIEFVHPPKRCNITQREVGRHTMSFANALRAALREDPDIIVIGELRDLETIEMAIRASETGHLVIGTLHTGTAATTMDRVLDVFPPNQQAQIRAMAAESLKGVICQQLVPNADGTGVVVASEVMLGTLAVGNIIREGETFKLPSIIQTSYKVGMCTFEQSMFDLFMEGRRSYDQTIQHVTNADLIKQMQTREAQRAAEAHGVKKKRWF